MNKLYHVIAINTICSKNPTYTLCVFSSPTGEVQKRCASFKLFILRFSYICILDKRLLYRVANASPLVGETSAKLTEGFVNESKAKRSTKFHPAGYLHLIHQSITKTPEFISGVSILNYSTVLYKRKNQKCTRNEFFDFFKTLDSNSFHSDRKLTSVSEVPLIHSTHAAHSATAACWHWRFSFRNVTYKNFGSQQQRRNGSRVLQSRASNFCWVDDAFISH